MESPRLDRAQHRLIVALVLVGIGDRELRDGVVERLGLAEVGGDRDPATRQTPPRSASRSDAKTLGESKCGKQNQSIVRLVSTKAAV